MFIPIGKQLFMLAPPQTALLPRVRLLEPELMLPRAMTVEESKDQNPWLVSGDGEEDVGVVGPRNT
jgi:hypothetical protein